MSVLLYQMISILCCFCRRDITQVFTFKLKTFLGGKVFWRGGGKQWSGTEFTITEATTGLLYQSQMMMNDDECGAIGGMFGRGNRSTWRKPAQCCVVHHKSHLT
jgi:hypothetical protein